MKVSEFQEISELEMIFLEDDVHCQSAHKKILECSHTVVARKRVACRGYDFLICQKSYDTNTQIMKYGKYGEYCPCGHPYEECWTITPV